MSYVPFFGTILALTRSILSEVHITDFSALFCSISRCKLKLLSSEYLRRPRFILYQWGPVNVADMKAGWRSARRISVSLMEVTLLAVLSRTDAMNTKCSKTEGGAKSGNAIGSWKGTLMMRFWSEVNLSRPIPFGVMTCFFSPNSRCKYSCVETMIEWFTILVPILKFKCADCTPMLSKQCSDPVSVVYVHPSQNYLGDTRRK